MSSITYWVLRNAPTVDETAFVTYFSKYWPASKSTFGFYEFVGSHDSDLIKKMGLEPYVVEQERAEEYILRVLAASGVIHSASQYVPRMSHVFQTFLKRSLGEETPIRYPWDVTWDNLMSIANK